MLQIIFALLFSIMFGFQTDSVSEVQRPPWKQVGSTTILTTTKEIPQDLQNIADKVSTAISSKNFVDLSHFIHPHKGLRFEPYLDSEFQGLVFDVEKFEEVYTSSEKHLWGHYDGSGYEIRLSFKDYYKLFVYGKDYFSMKPSYFSDFTGLSSKLTNAFGTSTNDWGKAYSEAAILYYYYPSEVTENYADWSALGLVFEQEKEQWYLVGIFHDQWEI